MIEKKLPVISALYWASPRLRWVNEREHSLRLLRKLIQGSSLPRNLQIRPNVLIWVLIVPCTHLYPSISWGELFFSSIKWWNHVLIASVSIAPSKAPAHRQGSIKIGRMYLDLTCVSLSFLFMKKEFHKLSYLTRRDRHEKQTREYMWYHF